MSEPTDNTPPPDEDPEKDDSIDESGDDSLDDELDDDFEDDGPLDMLAALKKPEAPTVDFGEAVEDKIRQRSGGRFFGERSLADRTSIGIIAVVILAIGLGVFWMLRGSETGSLKIKKGEKEPEMAPGAREAMPKP